MTPCSAACVGRFSRRPSSRSTCLRTSSGRSSAGELLAQLVGLGGRLVELAELVLDRLELLAQDELALRAVHLGLHLVLDLRADRDDLELAREHLGQAAQALGDVDLLEQRLLLLGRQPQRAGDQVAQRARVLDVGDGDLQLLGQVGHRLDDLRERLLDGAHQRRQLEATPRRRRAARRSRRRGRAPRPSSGRCARAGRPARAAAACRRGPSACARRRRRRRRRRGRRAPAPRARACGWRPSRACGCRPARR